MQATTAARVAYSAVALTIIGYPLLDKIEAIRTAPAPKPRSGGVTAELEAAAAAGAAAAAAALKGRKAHTQFVNAPASPAGCSKVAKPCHFSSSATYHFNFPKLSTLTVCCDAHSRGKGQEGFE